MQVQESVCVQVIESQVSNKQTMDYYNILITKDKLLCVNNDS